MKNDTSSKRDESQNGNEQRDCPDSAGSELPMTPRAQQLVAMATTIAMHDEDSYLGMEHFEAAIGGVGTKFALGKRFTREKLEKKSREFLLECSGNKVTDDYCRSLGIFVEFTHFLFQNK